MSLRCGPSDAQPCKNTFTSTTIACFVRDNVATSVLQTANVLELSAVLDNLRLAEVTMWKADDQNPLRQPFQNEMSQCN